MSELQLVLKREWYERIYSGQKKEEYREIKFPYSNQFGDCLDIPYDTIRFYLGYAKNRPTMQVQLKSIEIGEGVTDWGAEPGKQYYVLHLGPIIEQGINPFIVKKAAMNEGSLSHKLFACIERFIPKPFRKHVLNAFVKIIDSHESTPQTL